ncbi:MAG: aldehyde ferredoxin oxidoreductase family protein [Anaerolineaceae bacterium]
MPFGYNGRILHIDLTHQTFKVEIPDEAFYRKYLGGSALNCHYLFNMIPVGADPLGEKNVLAISVSVITGAAIAGQSRVVASAKSPLTGLIGDGQAGGYFPPEMKYAGFDAFIFTGRSPKPVYLWVDDGNYELKDASHLWGKTTGECEDQIKTDLGDDRIMVAQIGPAGERGVRYASIMFMCNHTVGRTGMGAVMGSKNLKAIVVRGRQGRKDFNVANPERFKHWSKMGATRFKGSPIEPLGRLGTAISVLGQSAGGQLPTNNFISGVFPGAEGISGELMYDQYLRGAAEGKQDTLGRETCFACPVRCKRVVEFRNEEFSIDKRYGGPEYETLGLMGSSCGIRDFPVIAKANEICNRYGLDTISCGGTIAWAMECFEKGLLTIEDTEGIELRFGDPKAYLKTVELIAMGSRFGDLLGLGSARAAEVLGKGSEKLVVAANRQEIPAHMPRVKVSLGIIYAVNPFGADHMSSGHDSFYENLSSSDEGASVPPFLQQLGLTTPTPPRSLGPEKMRFAVITQNYDSLMDSLCYCQFVIGTFGGLFDPLEVPEIVNAITGWDVTLEELLAVGERRVNLMRAFNAREGYTREKDQLPERMFEPLKGGPTDGFKLDHQEFETAKSEYYFQRGWDVKTGNPTLQKAAELGLEWTYSN